MTAPTALEALAGRVERHALDALASANQGDLELAVRFVTYALDDIAAALRARAKTPGETDVE